MYRILHVFIQANNLFIFALIPHAAPFHQASTHWQPSPWKTTWDRSGWRTCQRLRSSGCPSSCRSATRCCPLPSSSSLNGWGTCCRRLWASSAWSADRCSASSPWACFSRGRTPRARLAVRWQGWRSRFGSGSAHRWPRPRDSSSWLRCRRLLRAAWWPPTRQPHPAETREYPCTQARLLQLSNFSATAALEHCTTIFFFWNLSQ